MEGCEENSVLKPLTDECKDQPERPHELGLGFQSSPFVDPDVNLDPPSPPPPPDDLDRQTTYAEHQNQQIIIQEVQAERPVNEELQDQKTASKKLHNQEVVREELLILQTINEELQNLISEQEGKLREKGADRGDDVYGVENEANEKDTDHEVEAEGEDRKENDNAKVEEGVDESTDYDVGNRSEDAKEVNNKNDVEEATAVSAGLKDGKNRKFQYPVRSDADDCSYYMRTGSCKFGSNCKYNHPFRWRDQAAKERVKEKEENSERPGQTECKYYLRSGGCKFGDACRYNHSRGKTPVAPLVEFNFLGLPIRPGEKECPFYMRNGSCKYGSNCRFNHPDPTAVGGDDASLGYGNGESVSLHGPSQSTLSPWSSPRSLNGTGPFVPLIYSPTQGIPSPNAEWNNYQAPVYPTPERSLPAPLAFSLNIPAETNFYTYHKQQMLVDEFPERPGQPECSYFLRTGDCKYRSGCKFHHPKNRIPNTATCALSDKGLPLRPDQSICSHYNRYGICKFGPACKFDHPVNGHSASPRVAEPDAPSRMGRGENVSEALIQQPV